MEHKVWEQPSENEWICESNAQGQKPAMKIKYSAHQADPANHITKHQWGWLNDQAKIHGKQGARQQANKFDCFLRTEA
eukprot:1058172-Amphidinium_carterae.1